MTFSSFAKRVSLSLFGLALGLASCSKENNISQDSNVTCTISNLPAGSCPEGFSPEIAGQEQCGAQGSESCKTAGGCTFRCVDPRGCTAEGSKCGSPDTPACCGQAAGTHSCVRFALPSEPEPISVCSKRCEASSDCGTCCDALINGGAYGVCAPASRCLTKLSSACLQCVQTNCPDKVAACQGDATCSDCVNGKQFYSSPECLNNPAFKDGFACGQKVCAAQCETQ